MRGKANPTIWLLCVLLAAWPAQAKYGGGTGEPNDPYQVATAADLIALGETPEDYDKHFIMTADIDLDPNLPGRKVFDKAVIAPDADNTTYSQFEGTPFSGVFDGNDKTVSHLLIQGDGAGYLGLFGKITSSATIRSLHLEDFRVSSSGSRIGGLVGYSRGNIINCRLSGSVSGGTGGWCSYLGLLTGNNSGAIMHCSVEGSVSSGSAKGGSRLGLLTAMNRGTISYCDANGTVTTAHLFWGIGGLVGENLRSIADCHSAASISVIGDDVGGLVGTNTGVICRCYATGSLSYGRYTYDAGGLVGYNGGRIVNCRASGDVSGSYSNWRMGGLVGNNTGHVIYCYATGDVRGSGDIGGLVGQNRGVISHTYATGRVVGSPQSYIPVGGLVGNGKVEDVSRSYWDIEASGRTTSGGGEGLSTVQMQNPSTFLEAGWDFTGERTSGTGDVWQIPEGGGCPDLVFFAEGYLRRGLSGSGIQDDPYLIATAEDLGAILHHDTSACYRLVADVNLAGITWTTAVVPTFQGTFDGNNLTISNLSIRDGDCLGLFGVLEKGAVVQNLVIQDANIVGGSSASDLGILAVENWGQIADCQITGHVSGGRYEERLGGIVRYNLGTITNCDPVDYDGPYSVIIADPEATRKFLTFEGIAFDQIWIPEKADLEGLDSNLRTYLNPENFVQPNTWIDPEYILDNLPRYDREYSGFIVNDSKYIICQMILWSGFQGSCFIAEYEPGTKFTRIYDGGCGVVRVIFDAKSKAVISITCNGMA